MTLLLSKGADVNAKDSGGAVPLSVAILKGDIKYVKLLLDAGADPKISDSAGFLVAAGLGYLDIILLLIERGVDVNVQCEGGTALHVPAAKGKNNIIQALLDAGANIDAKEDQTSQTPLHFSPQPTRPSSGISPALNFKRGQCQRTKQTRINALNLRGVQPG